MKEWRVHNESIVQHPRGGGKRCADTGDVEDEMERLGHVQVRAFGRPGGENRKVGRPRPIPRVVSRIRTWNHPSRTGRCAAKNNGVAFGGGNGEDGGGNGGNGGGDDEDSEADGPAEEEDELLPLKNVEETASAQGIKLPADMLQIASTEGLKASALALYLKLQSIAGVGILVQKFPWIRDRMIADPNFLFKVFAEVAIDSGCATVAEVRKRADVFWEEFEFYLSDLVVGCVMDCVLVTLLAPSAVLGVSSKAARMASKTGLVAKLMSLSSRLPSNVFQASAAGAKFTLGQRFLCYIIKGLEYSLAGMVCGFVGQSFANSMMLVKRRMSTSDDHVPIPDAFRTALVWGLFMGVSSNTRYQVVAGLERAMELTPLAKSLPLTANVFTVFIRFVNNIYGGEQFVDMARWAGVQ